MKTWHRVGRPPEERSHAVDTRQNLLQHLQLMGLRHPQAPLHIARLYLLIHMAVEAWQHTDRQACPYQTFNIRARWCRSRVILRPAVSNSFKIRSDRLRQREIPCCRPSDSLIIIPIGNLVLIKPSTSGLDSADPELSLDLQCQPPSASGLTG